MIPRPPEEVFDYVADFSNLASWDPGIAESRQIDDGPIGEGSEFEVVADFNGRQIPMRYRITAFERPHRVVLEGEGETIRAVDDIRFQPEGQGTAVDYTADLTLTGLMGLIQPLLGSVLRRIGRKAIEGMESTLS